MKNKFTLLLTLALFGCNTFVNAQGSLLWAKNIGGNTGDYGNSIAVDASGNVYTAGYFSGIADLDPGVGVFNRTTNGGNDIFINKLDASGNFIWAITIGSSIADAANGIAVDASGNVYITGYFNGTADFDPGAGTYTMTPFGYNDAFVCKLTSSGAFVWAKKLGGASWDVGSSITVDASGNIYTTGYFNATADFDPGAGVSNLTSAGSDDVFVSKLDASGNFVWAKNMGSANSDNGNSIAVDASGNVYLTGMFSGTADFDPGVPVYTVACNGNSDIFVNKLDASGNFVWAKAFGGPYIDVGRSVKVDGTGNVYSTGNFDSNVDFDPGNGVYTLTNTIIGVPEIFVSKLDASGAFVWAQAMGGPNPDTGYGIDVDQLGNVYTAGSFNGQADFDPGTAAFYLVVAGNTDAYVSKLDPSGNFIWAQGFGGAGWDAASSICVDAIGNVHVAGTFNATADFDPGFNLYNLTSAGLEDVFILKLDDSNGSTVKESNSNKTVAAIYPNPNSGAFNLQVKGEIFNGDLILINSLGQKVHEQKIIEGINTVTTNDLAKGLYSFILLQDKQKVTDGKIMVQ